VLVKPLCEAAGAVAEKAAIGDRKVLHHRIGILRRRPFSDVLKRGFDASVSDTGWRENLPACVPQERSRLSLERVIATAACLGLDGPGRCGPSDGNGFPPPMQSY